jgi:hypothetical protein
MDYDIERIVQTLRSVADYLIAVKTTADELRGHGVSVDVDLDELRGDVLQLLSTVEAVVARAQRQAIIIVSNPPFSGGVS